MQPHVGESYGPYRYTKVLPIKELQLTLLELIHEPTGATIMHLACDEKENVFSLSFQTFPYSSDGVAHILEHTTLCGSKKFPVKDPFFSMNRRSLNTFMNAFTGPDFTCYPAATQIEQDFYNLLEVYLDAVFHPTLDKMSFLQEGHRFEFETKDDISSPLVYRGIVFNEMKGSLTNPDGRLWQEVMKHLVPDLPYAFNSGGDPKEIPHLTYEQLKAFHATYYHPSHAIFYFYGNLPTEKHLDFLTKNLLSEVQCSPPLPPIAKQKRFKAPRTHAFTYPASAGDLLGKTYFSLTWLTTPVTSQQDALGLSVLDSILMDTDASPLRATIVESGLCTHADGYMDQEMSEIPYSIICRGTDRDKTEKLESLIMNRLSELARDGIPPHIVDSAIHHLEFHRTEIGGDSYPFGITLFMRAVLSMQHGCPPENAIELHSQFEKLHALISEPRYFNSLIEKYFINNPHRLTVVMTPDTKQAAREDKEEKNRLQKINERLTSDEKDQIVTTAKELEAFQEKSESIDCLPKIHLSDVPKKIPTYPLTQKETLSYHPCFTNYILYADLIFDLPDLTIEELPYAKLLTSLLLELGAGKRSYAENIEYIHAHTGGVSCAIALHTDVNPEKTSHPTLSIRGKVLERNSKHLFIIFEQTLNQARLDEKSRIKDLILQLNTSLQNRLSSSPMSYAINLALSGNSSDSYITSLLSGLPYVHFIKDLAQNIDEKLPHIIEQFKAIAEKLFHNNDPKLIISASDEMVTKLPPLELNTKPFTPWSNTIRPQKPTSQIRHIASPVAFTALGLQTIPLTHNDAAALSVGSQLLDNLGLHKKIREQGGAYGSGSSYDHCQGNFYFYSYRDPHIAQTLQAFKETTQEIVDGKFTSDDLEEAKLGLVQSLDHPVSPGNRAITTFSLFRDGKTDDVRQTFRDRVLSLTSQDIQESLKNHIKFETGITAIFTGEELSSKEELDLPTSPA